MGWFDFKMNWRNNQEVKPSDLNAQGIQLNALMSLLVGPLPIVNNYYFATATAGPSTNSNLGYNTLRLSPWEVRHPIRLDRVFVDVATVGDVGAVFRYGIYKDDGYNRPGTRMLDATTGALTSATVVSTTVNVTLQPGRYWIGGVLQGTGTQPTLRVGVANAIESRQPLGTSLPPANVAYSAAFQASVGGTLPANFTWSGAAQLAPRIGYRVAEVL